MLRRDEPITARAALRQIVDAVHFMLVLGLIASAGLLFICVLADSEEYDLGEAVYGTIILSGLLMVCYWTGKKLGPAKEEFIEE